MRSRSFTSAVHLQLTMIEAMEPLVSRADESAFSPWQQNLRPIGGVLHALYVFTVIYAHYQAVREIPSLTPAEKEFVDKRRREIIDEVRNVGDLTAGSGLTIEGQVLFRRLLQRFGSDGFRRTQEVDSHGAEL